MSSDPKQYDISTFAGKIREKYPNAYDKVPDDVLVGSFLEKYPVYKSRLKFKEIGDDPVATLSKEAHASGMHITSGKRTPAEQHKLFLEGRTKADKFSHHLLGNALDINAVDKDPKKTKAFYHKLRATYGPDAFKEFLLEKDHVHVAWTGTKKAAAKAAPTTESSKSMVTLDAVKGKPEKFNLSGTIDKLVEIGKKTKPPKGFNPAEMEMRSSPVQPTLMGPQVDAPFSSRSHTDDKLIDTLINQYTNNQSPMSLLDKTIEGAGRVVDVASRPFKAFDTAVWGVLKYESGERGLNVTKAMTEAFTTGRIPEGYENPLAKAAKKVMLDYGWSDEIIDKATNLIETGTSPSMALAMVGIGRAAKADKVASRFPEAAPSEFALGKGRGVLKPKVSEAEFQAAHPPTGTGAGAMRTGLYRPHASQLAKEFELTPREGITKTDYSLRERAGYALAKVPRTWQAAKQTVDDAIKELVGPEPLRTSQMTTGGSVKLKNKAAWKSRDFREAIKTWQEKLQLNDGATRKLTDAIYKLVPSKLTREAINKWIDAHGDPTLLAEGAHRLKNAKTLDDLSVMGRDDIAILRAEGASHEEIQKALKAQGDVVNMTRSQRDRIVKIYEAASSLNDADKQVAGRIGMYFDAMLEDAMNEGLVKEGVSDYINRIAKDPNQAKGILNRFSTDFQQGRFPTTVQAAKHRIFEYQLDAERAGVEYETYDIARLIPHYNETMGEAVANRRLVDSLFEGFAADGRPILAIKGAATDTGEAILVQPGQKGMRTNLPKVTVQRIGKNGKPLKPKTVSMGYDNSDYVEFNHPAFRDWKFVGQVEGKPIILEGNALVHPDFIKDFTDRLGTSSLRGYKTTRGLLALNRGIKGIDMFGGMFHQVHVDIHGATHFINPFKDLTGTALDVDSPEVQDMVHSGVQLFGGAGKSDFREGVTSWIGRSHAQGKLATAYNKIAGYSDWLFDTHIPRMKMEFYRAALKRNTNRFSGKLGVEEIKELTASQTNASFGELNYRLMGRNKTVQDVFRLFVLSPDFTEARFKYLAQAFSKYGTEQRRALMINAGGLITMARILNMAISGDPHWDEPFGVVIGEKTYGVRSVPGDLLHAYEHFGKFLTDRLAPVPGATFRGLYGIDRFGRPSSAGKILEEELPRPMFLHSKLPGEIFNISFEDSLASALGLNVRQYMSPDDRAMLERRHEGKERRQERYERRRLNE